MARYLIPLTLLAALLVPGPGSSTPSTTSTADAHDICCRPLLLQPCCYRPLRLRPLLVRNCCFPLRPRIIVSYRYWGPVVIEDATPAADKGGQPTPAKEAAEETNPVPDLSQPPQSEDPDNDEPSDDTPDDPDAPADPDDPADPESPGDAPKASDPDAAVTIDLHIPADARVKINGHITRQTGIHRHYTSKIPAGSTASVFTIEAEIVRAGQQIRQTRTLSLGPGQTTSLTMDLLDKGTTTTSLTLDVPAEARVTLQGQETSMRGEIRLFRTHSLSPGQTWKGYTVEVQHQQDGKTVSSRVTIDLVGGQTHRLTIPVRPPSIVQNR
jgi:uncharacterized protein (TIGR03000 family)